MYIDCGGKCNDCRRSNVPPLVNEHNNNHNNSVLSICNMSVQPVNNVQLWTMRRHTKARTLRCTAVRSELVRSVNLCIRANGRTDAWTGDQMDGTVGWRLK